MRIEIGGRAQLFYSPKKIIFGIGVAKNLTDECRLLGRRALIVTDNLLAKGSMLQGIMDQLREAGIEVDLYGGVLPEPPLESVDDGAERAVEGKFEVIIGIGGGSSLDTAKGVSVVATNGGKIADYVGLDQVPKPGLPLILVPTTAGTGSEVTRVLIVTDVSENMKKAVFSVHCLADTALVDPMLTLSMPPNVTADTGMDALVHAIETYVAVSSTCFSDLFAEKAISWISKYLPVACAKGENIEARYFMALAATYAGLAFASGGLGAVHGLAYPLGTEYHMAHGRSNAIMLPHIMAYNLPGNFEKYARIAVFMGEEVAHLSPADAAFRSVEAVKRLQGHIGISSRLKDYGVKKEELGKLVEGGLKQTRLFVPNPRNLAKEDLEKIYDMAF